MTFCTRHEAYSLFANHLFALDFPQHLYIEPTDHCQLSCAICPRKFSKRKKGFMDIELFRLIISQSLRFGRRERIMLYKDGEPLLHPKLGVMIGIAKKSQAAETISISTNGLELNREKAKELLAAGLDEIIISLDGACKETYESIRLGSDYERVIKNLQIFLSLKKSERKKSPRVVVQIVDMDKTREEIAIFKKKWIHLIDEVRIREFHTWGGYINESSLEQKNKRNPCFSLWTTLAVNWDGDVSICSLDFNKQAVLGNVKESSLYEIWQSPRLKKLRIRHLGGDFENLSPCDSCSGWQYHPDFWTKQNIEKAKELVGLS